MKKGGAGAGLGAIVGGIAGGGHGCGDWRGRGRHGRRAGDEGTGGRDPARHGRERVGAVGFDRARADQVAPASDAQFPEVSIAELASRGRIRSVRPATTGILMSLEGRPGLLTAPAIDPEPPFPNMVWVPGTTYSMGSDHHYPEERPAHRVSVDGFWMDREPVTNERFARFVAETGHVTLAEIVPDPSQYPGALPHMIYAGSLLFVQPEGPVDRANIGNWWTFKRGADWRHPQGPSSSLEGSDAASGRARRLRRCRGLRGVGGEDAAERGRMGARRPRRARGEGLRVGRRVPAGRQAHGQHLAGRVPVAEPAERRLPAHLAGRRVPGERLRPAGHDRQRLGVDHRLVRAASSPRSDQGLLHAAQSPRTARDRELRSAPARDSHPPQGDQRRLAPLRAKLLPQIPARGALPGADRHLHVSPRLPLHRPADAPRRRPLLRMLREADKG